MGIEEKFENENENVKKILPRGLIEGHTLVRVDILCPIDDKKNKKVASIDFIELGDFSHNQDLLSEYLKSAENKKSSGETKNTGINLNKQAEDLRKLERSLKMLEKSPEGIFKADYYILDFLQSSVDLEGKIFSISCLSKNMDYLGQSKYSLRLFKNKFDEKFKLN